MNIPSLKIGDLIASMPIIQGGMGVGVSGANLASAVANAGGIGVIAGVGIGYREPDFIKNFLEANLRAVRSEIRKAKELSPSGIIGMNFMVAMNHYNEMVREAVKEGIDLIISGAGLPLKLPELVKGFKTRIAPIVSSGKATKVILKYWDVHYGKTADAIVLEGPEAGGHLGFSEAVLMDENRPTLIDLLQDVIEAVKPYQEKYNADIPIVAAGGVYSGADIVQCLQAGASGVQMSTRFVTTDECDADIRFKEAYINATCDDISIIISPVGMPGRALNNPFIQRVTESGDQIKACFRCLKGCNPAVAPYCIFRALTQSISGEVDDGVVFVGSNAYRNDKIVPVQTLMNELRDEMLAAE